MFHSKQLIILNNNNHYYLRMLIDKEDIIIIVICVIISLCLTIYLNRHRFNCCKKKDSMTMYKEQLKNNSFEDNINLIKILENQDK